MPAKKSSQSKDPQAQQQSQTQPVPSSSSAMTSSTVAAAAAGKAEASQQQQLVQLLQENSDPVTVVMSVVDKKVRNLEKRKVKLLSSVFISLLQCIVCAFCLCYQHQDNFSLFDFS